MCDLVSTALEVILNDVARSFGAGKMRERSHMLAETEASMQMN